MTTPIRPLKLYLDTSILNFVVSTQDVAKEKQQTIRLLRLIEEGEFEGYISEVVIREIDRTPERKREELYGVLKVLLLTLFRREMGGNLTLK